MTSTILGSRISCHIREASLDDDHAKIAALSSRYGLRMEPQREWKQFCVNNPVYRRLKSHWPIGWVLENENTDIVGYLENVPLSYELDAATLVAATPRTWVVDEDYRGYSLLLLDTFFSQRQVDFFISTTGNKRGSGGFCALGGLPIPRTLPKESLFWITNERGFAASWLRLKSAPLANILKYPISSCLALESLFRNRHSSIADNSHVEQCETFDGRFDVFWTRLKAENPNVLLCNRGRDFLAWHFHNLCLRDAIWTFTLQRRAELIGYSIFRRLDNPDYGLKRMLLVDFQVAGNDLTLFLPMLAQAVRRCREEGIHMLEITGPRILESEIVKNSVPHQRWVSSWPFFYKTPRESLAERLKDPDVWAPSLYDGDSSF